MLQKYLYNVRMCSAMGPLPTAGTVWVTTIGHHMTFSETKTR